MTVPAAVKVAGLAHYWWGDEPAVHMARVLGLREITARRMVKAGDAGRDYRGADAVWAKFQERIEEARTMSRMDWGKAKRRRDSEEANPRDDRPKGGWTHVKPAPVKTYTAEERAAFMRERSRR